jgi:prepilin-type N-terminal cleavage/methylation domain-containing protein
MRFIQRRAFTLVELLVVIAIIGMLSSVAVVATSSTREKARITAGMSFASQIDRAAGAGEGGEWYLNEGSGTTASDRTGGGSTGTLVNGPVWSTDTPANTGFSLSLDGSNDYVSAISYSFPYKGSGLTLAIWIKPDAGETGGGLLFSKPWNGAGEYNYTLSYGSGRNIGLGLSGASTYYMQTTATVPAGRWTFVAATVDSSKNIKIYIDGAIKASATHDISSWTPAIENWMPLVIGSLYPYGSGWGGNSGFSFNGLIDDPRVFNDAFSAERIKKLYAEGPPSPSSGIASR